MDKIYTKIKANVIACELSCVNCHDLKLHGETDKKTHYLQADFEKIVMQDYVCPKCGCNAFDVTAFIKTTIE